MKVLSALEGFAIKRDKSMDLVIYVLSIQFNIHLFSFYGICIRWLILLVFLSALSLY